MMAIDLSKPLVDANKCRIEKKDGLWTYFMANEERRDSIPPQISLIAIIRIFRYRMGFYDLNGELQRWGITIQDCFLDDRRKTIEALEDMFGSMLGMAIGANKKYLQYRNCLVDVRDNCEVLDHEINKLLSGFLEIWDSLTYPED
jgi:uncharacterized protein YqgQ